MIHLHDFVYYLSIATIIGTCVGAVVHPRVHTGIVGSVALAAVALFTVAAFDYSEPANWRLGQVIACAVLCWWFVIRFYWRRAKMKRRLIQVICDCCPLHEDR